MEHEIIGILIRNKYDRMIMSKSMYDDVEPLQAFLSQYKNKLVKITVEVIKEET